MSNRYYSDLWVVKWLRVKVFKIDKPFALPFGHWSLWEKETKKNFPVGYFFTETLPDWLEKIPEHTIDYIHKVRVYVRNRIDKTHSLNSKLEKGSWHEFDERLLHCVFDSYLDFIEVETALHTISCGGGDTYKKYNVPWHQRFALTSWYRWRCPQAGVDHLKWEMSLGDESDPQASINKRQAESAFEKMALYSWWKHIRPARKDPWAETGLRDFWNRMDAKYGKHPMRDWTGLGGKRLLSPAEDAEYRKLMKATHELEEARHEEDTEMLIRLIKIRDSLWT